jgi:MurNAc alpha-1-phosphate uridylyltransferase
MMEEMEPSRRVSAAMVLAAGLGKRMRPLTDSTPKPLVRLAGRPLIDHVLDRIGEAGIAHVCVNVHYLADQLERHLEGRQPVIYISDERDCLLDTGGGVRHALPHLPGGAFLVHNSDSIWMEAGVSNIANMMRTWDPDVMDGLLLLAVKETSTGYEGEGDFFLDADGRIQRRPAGGTAPYVFTGVSILAPRVFDGINDPVFSLNRVFDRCIAASRLFGVVLDGVWMHVGSEQGLIEAEGRLTGLESRRPYASTD